MSFSQFSQFVLECCKKYGGFSDCYMGEDFRAQTLGLVWDLHGFSWIWLLIGSAIVTTRLSSTSWPRFQHGSLDFSSYKDESPSLGMMPSILASRTCAMPSCKGTSNQESFSLKTCMMYIRDRSLALFQSVGLENLKSFFQSDHEVDISFYLTKDHLTLLLWGTNLFISP